MTAKKKDKMEVKTNESMYRCVCHKRRSLGALSFHPDVKGRLITLSEGGRRATRDQSSFCHGLVFSGRPVKIREKVRLRIEVSVGTWHGSLRLGFANVAPEHTAVPPLAIPNLTDSPLYAAAVIPDDICYPGAEIEFWVDRHGNLCIQSSDGPTFFHPTSLNVHWPIWAMMDVYGQASAVELLGSRKKGLLYTYRSCSALTHNRRTNDNCSDGDVDKEIWERMKKQMSMQDQRNHCPDNTDNEAADNENCVVCFSPLPKTLLSCGHKCVCTRCAIRVYEMFGTCPLCRQPIQPIPCN